MRAYIPPNLNSNSRILGGIIKKKNAIEALIYLVIVFLLVKFISLFAGLIVCVVLFLALGLPGAILFLIGINNQSIVTIILNVIKYNQNKTVATMRLPQFTIKGKERRK